MTLWLLAALLLLACGKPAALRGDRESPKRDPSREQMELELGKSLFFEPLLSHDGQTACASCHNPEHAFADSRALSVGSDGHVQVKNTPSLFNVGEFGAFTWSNPLLRSLEQQLLVPLFVDEPREMGAGVNPELILSRLASQTKTQQVFEALYGRKLEHIRDVVRPLEVFVRSLSSVDSPWDSYQGGEKGVLSEEAQQGWTVFQELGCVSCHVPPLFTNHQTNTSWGLEIFFQGIGMDETGSHNTFARGSWGLFEFTLKEEDRGKFRVPSLRNVALTAPYFHDGREVDLLRAIESHASVLEAQGLLGRALREETEAGLLEHFLGSLTGTESLHHW